MALGIRSRPGGPEGFGRGLIPARTRSSLWSSPGIGALARSKFSSQAMERISDDRSGLLSLCTTLALIGACGCRRAAGEATSPAPVVSPDVILVSIDSLRFD